MKSFAIELPEKTVAKLKKTRKVKTDAQVRIVLQKLVEEMLPYFIKEGK